MKDRRVWIAAGVAAVMTALHPDIKELIGVPAVLLFLALFSWYMAWLCIGNGISNFLQRKKQ